ncbi:MAG: mechanosensitive ion channel domain-containing protein [Pseudomonadota bacterium]
MRNFSIIFIFLALAWLPIHAQEESAVSAGVIEAAEETASDEDIRQRIRDIFNQIEELSSVQIIVDAGVVTLSGQTLTSDAAARAEELAARVEGVVTVENQIERDVSVSTRVTPALEQLQGYRDDVIKLLPLIILALVVFLTIASFGWLITAWKPFWQKITPNAFVAELVRSTMRTVFLLLALVVALSLLDATALLSAFLGAAGVLGLAIGFAVRDTIENYISSVMLSLRQPFRPNDHVVIDEHEGHVIRLTSRATILMTLQGNHLRIPNASVFKAIILNYTRNPERRLDFELGVDAEDDPLAAIQTGLAALEDLPFILKEPGPLGHIRQVGDSNIVIFFAAWIDQRTADYAKSRSIAVAAAKNALEEEGFALPEPIYRLRFDQAAPAIFQGAEGASITPQSSDGKRDSPSKQSRQKSKHDQMADVTPDDHLAEKIDEERRENIEEDLLKEDGPVE